ncbi:ArsR/SmtB family transcription factor [Paenibacillus sp. CAU 1782]
MNINVSTEQVHLFEALASESRIHMIKLLEVRPMNIKEMAEALGFSSAIVTKHVQKLEEAGIIVSEGISGLRGRQKVCRLAIDEITLQFRTPAVPAPNRYNISIPIGHYTDYHAKPTCGLASSGKIIGMFDDPRYFSDPERTDAAHLWFSSGFVEYRIPNYLLSNQKADAISITLELCSEAPGFNENWPSDIHFYLNDVSIGYWTCPGDFGSNRGVHTPEWWKLGTQHGLLKTIQIKPQGSYIDGMQMSDIAITQIPLPYGEDIRFRIAAPETGKNAGGLSLFGKQFGNYNQDIQFEILYGDK